MNKRYLIHAAGRNLGVILRARHGIGTPRSLQDGFAALCAALQHALRGLLEPRSRFCGLRIATEVEDTGRHAIFAPSPNPRAAACIDEFFNGQSGRSSPRREPAFCV